MVLKRRKSTLVKRKTNAYKHRKLLKTPAVLPDCWLHVQAPAGVFHLALILASINLLMTKPNCFPLATQCLHFTAHKHTLMQLFNLPYGVKTHITSQM